MKCAMWPTRLTAVEGPGTSPGHNPVCAEERRSAFPRSGVGWAGGSRNVRSSLVCPRTWLAGIPARWESFSVRRLLWRSGMLRHLRWRPRDRTGETAAARIFERCVLNRRVHPLRTGHTRCAKVRPGSARTDWRRSARRRPDHAALRARPQGAFLGVTVRTPRGPDGDRRAETSGLARSDGPRGRRSRGGGALLESGALA